MTCLLESMWGDVDTRREDTPYCLTRPSALVLRLRCLSPSLCASLPPSLPASLPPSLPVSLPRSLPTSPLSLPLPPSLPPPPPPPPPPPRPSPPPLSNTFDLATVYATPPTPRFTWGLLDGPACLVFGMGGRMQGRSLSDSASSSSTS